MTRFEPNTKGEYDCPKCDKTFPKPQAVRMHMLRVHSRKIRVPNEGVRKTTKSRKALRNGTVDATVKFCPCCGTNIEAVAVAMSITR